MLLLCVVVVRQFLFVVGWGYRGLSRGRRYKNILKQGYLLVCRSLGTISVSYRLFCRKELKLIIFLHTRE